jgi:hypothetical protein
MRNLYFAVKYNTKKIKHNRNAKIPKNTPVVCERRIDNATIPITNQTGLPLTAIVVESISLVSISV